MSRDQKKRGKNTQSKMQSGGLLDSPPPQKGKPPTWRRFPFPASPKEDTKTRGGGLFHIPIQQFTQKPPRFFSFPPPPPPNLSVHFGFSFGGFPFPFLSETAAGRGGTHAEVGAEGPLLRLLPQGVPGRGRRLGLSGRRTPFLKMGAGQNFSPGDCRLWSLFPFTRVPFFWVPIFEPTLKLFPGHCSAI